MARRLFALFVACALAPLASFALYAFDRVSGELERQASRRLEAASKEAGMGLLERLLLLDAELRGVAARVEDAGSRGLPPERLESLEERFEAVWSAGVDGRPIRTLVGEAQALPAFGPEEQKRIRTQGSLLRTSAKDAEDPSVLLVRAVEGDRPAPRYLVGRVRRAFLWRLVRGAGHEAITIFDATGRVLASSLPDDARPPPGWSSEKQGEVQEWSAGGEPQRGASWTLFLTARFGAASWTVVRSEPRSWILEPVRGFERSFLLVAALALALVALLSHAWIRRTLRPLQALREGAIRIGERELSARVPVRGEDEFADVGRAFNRMAHDLNLHFRALDRLLRIDQEILSTSDASELAELVALRALSLCDCDATLVAATGLDESDETIVFAATAGDERARRETRSLRLPETGGADVLDLALEEASGDALDALRRLGMRHARLVPLVRSRVRLGMLVVGREESAFRADESAAYVRQLADQTSAALAHLHERERNRVLAYYDALTGLPNRLMFHERLQQAILHSRGARSCAVCIVRLEGLRRIHETLGLRIGDELLRKGTERIARANRAGDTFRFEGSELGILLWDLESPDGAARVAQCVLDAFRAPFHTSEGEVVLSARVGVAVHPQDGSKAELLERNARAALHSTGEEAPGHYRFYSPAMSESSRERLALETDLRHAIDRGELGLALHPIVAVDSRELVGAEALVRWSRGGEPVSPDRFIPIAEEAGLIGELGEWMLRTACRMLSGWIAEGLPPIRLHVNVSAHQLRDERLYAVLRSLLHETGLPRGLLDLEITESAVMKHSEKTRDLLSRIRALGIGLAIDDFGKEYSSLTHVRNLSVDTLKIDRSFVDRVHEDPADAALARAIVAMAHGLGLRVIAEGVEREEHLAFLREERCDDAQGFLFSQPLPPDAFRKHLREEAARGAVCAAHAAGAPGTGPSGEEALAGCERGEPPH